MNIYRDPELARLYGENLDLEKKLLAVEEELRQLRNTLKKKTNKINPPLGSLPSNHSLFTRIMCHWFGIHTYSVYVEEHTLNFLTNKGKFTREQLFFNCTILCENCAHVEKEPRSEWSRRSFVEFVNVVSIFERFCQEVFRQHPEWDWENA